MSELKPLHPLQFSLGAFLIVAIFLPPIIYYGMQALSGILRVHFGIS